MINGIKMIIENPVKKFKARKKARFAFGSKIIGNVVFKGSNFLDKYASIIDSELGFASYVGNHSILNKVKVGNYTCIGPNVSIVFGNHPISKFVSVHPAFYSLAKQSGFTFVQRQLFADFVFTDEGKQWYVEIGNDVWIGDGAKIMSGVKISDGAVIAAGAVVVKDVEPYTIVGGVPAKPIKKRFNDDQIKYLLSIKWWDKDQVELEKMSGQFTDIDMFIKQTSTNRGN